MVPSHDQISGFTKPPFLIEHATQLLVQATVIFRISCCHARLAGAPTCVVKPQMVQGHITSLLFKLHRLPVAACMKLNSLMRTYRRRAGAAPPYLNKTHQTHATPHLLHRRLQRASAGSAWLTKDTTREKAKGTHHEGERVKWCFMYLTEQKMMHTHF